MFAVGAHFETARSSARTRAPQGAAGTEYYDVAGNEAATEEHDPVYDENFGWYDAARKARAHRRQQICRAKSKSSPNRAQERLDALVGATRLLAH